MTRDTPRQRSRSLFPTRQLILRITNMSSANTDVQTFRSLWATDGWTWESLFPTLKAAGFSGIEASLSGSLSPSHLLVSLVPCPNMPPRYKVSLHNQLHKPPYSPLPHLHLRFIYLLARLHWCSHPPPRLPPPRNLPHPTRTSPFHPTGSDPHQRPQRK